MRSMPSQTTGNTVARAPHNRPATLAQREQALMLASDLADNQEDSDG